MYQERLSGRSALLGDYMNYDAERESLEMIYAVADDYLLALSNEAFCREYGGIERFLDSLKLAVSSHGDRFNRLGDGE
jgi:hypothetical protein